MTSDDGKDYLNHTVDMKVRSQSPFKSNPAVGMQAEGLQLLTWTGVYVHPSQNLQVTARLLSRETWLFKQRRICTWLERFASDDIAEPLL